MYPISKSSCLLDSRLRVPYGDTIEPIRNAYDACSHLIHHVQHRLLHGSLHGIHHDNMMPRTLHFPPRLLTPSRDLIERHQQRHWPLASPFTSPPSDGRRSGLTVFGNDYETPDGTGMVGLLSLFLFSLMGCEILKDRPSWFRDCRAVDVRMCCPQNGGTIELLYMQLYAPTTLALARDFWLLRYTSVLEDGSLVHFVRAEMLPSGYLIRPCEGGGSIIHIVDHMDLESNVTGWGRRPTALRALRQRLSHGFNEAINGFTDEGWSIIGNDGVDDVTVLVNSSPDKLMGLNHSFSNGFPAVECSIVCQSFYVITRSRIGNYGGQVILPLAHTIEHEKFLEVIKLEGIDHSSEDTIMPKKCFFCNGMDENAVGTCVELIFAPIDASFADDAPLLPSGFRIIPLDSGKEASNPNRTLDLASALDVGTTGNRASNDYSGNSGYMRYVMTIAFEFAFENHMQEHVASMARQYVCSIISFVQRVALALSPSHLSSQAGLRTPLGTPEAQTLARWICNSYREPFVFQLWMFDRINFVGATWVSSYLNLIMRGTNLCSSPCGITQMQPDNKDDQQPSSATGHYGNDY
ncbi:hypothetical protein Fmac_011565 [Flemingia macrophylla]|uniref:START domain-containing protein n=1 Tax=Flemingia macrophylla TaxID=520843 RepID=A0ABD1MMT9_9FABA